MSVFVVTYPLQKIAKQKGSTGFLHPSLFLYLRRKTVSQMCVPHDEQLFLIERKLKRAKQARCDSDDLLRSMDRSSCILLLSRPTSFLRERESAFPVADERAVASACMGCALLLGQSEWSNRSGSAGAAHVVLSVCISAITMERIGGRVQAVKRRMAAVSAICRRMPCFTVFIPVREAST